MEIGRTLEAKEVALIICFTVLYVYFSFVPAFPIVGLPSKAVTLAAITAPIIGIILGPYLGLLSTILGGIIGLFFAASFSFPSFVSGIVAAVFAGMLRSGNRSFCAFVYFSLLLLFGFYPFVGPVWLYPPFMWFQIFGLLILISPLQSRALMDIQSLNNSSRYLCGLFIIFLNSTLAGQIAGSLIFELISWPIFMVNIGSWRGIWQLLTWLYPIERMIITLSSTLIGASLCRILTNANLSFLVDRSETVNKT